MVKRINPEWYKEWKDMPEFIQEDKESIKFVMVHFETEEDMQAFSDLVGRKITMKTKGFFFPVNNSKIKKVYVDES